MVLIRGFLYEVTDPVHPRLLCRISNTSAHFYNANSITYLKSDPSFNTNVILHALDNGFEREVAQILFPRLDQPGPFATTWWSADGTVAATTIPPTQPTDGGLSRVWVDSPGFIGDLYHYPYPVADCICRFGLSQPVTSVSPDRQYVVAGWPIVKGSGAVLSVYRLSDQKLVKTFDNSVAIALWDAIGHRLFASGSAGSISWTPEGGQLVLPHAAWWEFLAGMSPDASQVAYTAYVDTASPNMLRVYVYDIKSDKTRMLVDASRSQAIFVKQGWVWYLDEPACDPNQATCAPWGTAPSGKVFAMNLATGIEQQVVFASGEATTDLVPGEFWPNS